MLPNFTKKCSVSRSAVVCLDVLLSMLNCFSFICHSHRCLCRCSFSTTILHAITLIIRCNFPNCCLAFTCYLPISTLLHLCTFFKSSAVKFCLFRHYDAMLLHHCIYVRVHSCCLYFFHSIQCDAVAPRCVCKC